MTAFGEFRLKQSCDCSGGCLFGCSRLEPGLCSKAAPSASCKAPFVWMIRSVTTATALNLDTAGKHTDRERVLIGRKAGDRSGVVDPIVASRTFERDEHLSNRVVREAIKRRLIAVETTQASN
uniref:Uncharacterized protein n=1 Tax=Opuntia streptacantha TaxID=393608 RepID=A0A7C9FRD0_OPUST